ncbi:hypothetical protein ACFL3V_05495 [Nanoarchaeota archaeon]
MVSIQTVITPRRVGFSAFLIIIFIAFSMIATAQTSTSCPIAAYEGDLVRLSPAAMDPDPEIGPAGKLLWSFGPPFDSAGQWQTVKGIRGIFDFWVSVSDGELKDTKYSCVDVLPNNRNPILSPVPEVYLTRGQNSQIQATCSDPDGDPVKISYRFRGKDVAYIFYEPPGTYDLEVICTDDFGGRDSEKTKIHIDMPYVPPQPKPKKVVYVPEEKEPQVVEVKLQTPGDIELVLPKQSTPQPVEVNYPVEDDCPGCDPEVIEVRYPNVCDPCPAETAPEPMPDNIDVVLYNTSQSLYGNLDTETFVLEQPKPAPAPVPAAPVIDEEPEEDDCDKNIQRKEEITKALGCCN